MIEIDKYTTIELIEDLKKELQKLSEELTILFPERVYRYSDRDLSRFWRGSNYQYIHRVKYKISNINSPDYKPNFRFSERVGNLKILENKLKENYGKKAINIINQYKNPNLHITTLQFIDKIIIELGRISGELIITDRELSIMMSGYDTFIRDVLDTINNSKSKRWYNPDYKFTRERLDDFKDFLKEIFGDLAINCFKLIKKYEEYNPDLKYWHEKDYTIINPNFFHEIDSERKAYWYGFLCADAYLNVKRNRIQFELSLKDKDRIEQFVETLGLDKDRIEKQLRYMIYKGNIIQFESVRIRFSSKEVASDLNALGFSEFKKGKIGLPGFVKQKIFEAKSEVKKNKSYWTKTKSGKIALAFLLGFYDGDGTFMGGNQAKIYSSNKLILDEIKYFFNISNKVNRQSILPQEIYETLTSQERRSKKPLYYLTLGPEVFKSMINCYDYSMKRKHS
ncbi:MAG: LAGLIDADG family homing endonuclease [Candidatus Hermodarchaeota archaeon]